MLIRLLALVYVFHVLEVSRGETLKLELNYGYMRDYGFGLFTLVVADGKRLHTLVDTASDSFILIWKRWLEQASGLPCSAWLMGCYKCSKSCLKGKVTKVISFEDDYMVHIVEHKAKLTLGQVSPILTFGLIFGQKPSISEVAPSNSMGLGYDKGDVNFPSLMTQLLASKTVTTGTFALYLSPPADPSHNYADGGLLLGGGDPALYEGGLKYVDFTSDKHYMVNLDKLQVGDGHITPGINMELYLDTGSNNLYVPKLYYNGLIEEIKAQTDKAAGTHVDFTFHTEDEMWQFPCEHIRKLPRLRFGLGPNGVTPFTMTYMNYARNISNVCALLISEDEGDYWLFGDRMLIGNYFEFDPTSKRVGIGKLKS
ncbi:Cathepsin D precursor, putative [Perkinsus marinus ATCC 50983]|uniref:Cathepsin D, putative n=1 Tax=Perkinsus marinus (strain ATCC 50983 / TXsc) TaxID=423536 RepID=C5KV97_PERM5|nr:Cathepsin D precursor, putative [Perkinsus marinus ATCC 50983]EER11643.1 Cathepsin D precursor, putative [Perkinsus marinus ATCC 50983]|eukprot:XP_002779848.1 Cathepsin D precursor, putative [Perkinsus marinus ATCC 50983]